MQRRVWRACTTPAHHRCPIVSPAGLAYAHAGPVITDFAAISAEPYPSRQLDGHVRANHAAAAATGVDRCVGVIGPVGAAAVTTVAAGDGTTAVTSAARVTSAGTDVAVFLPLPNTATGGEDTVEAPVDPPPAAGPVPAVDAASAVVGSALTATAVDGGEDVTAGAEDDSAITAEPADNVTSAPPLLAGAPTPTGHNSRNRITPNTSAVITKTPTPLVSRSRSFCRAHHPARRRRSSSRNTRRPRRPSPRGGFCANPADH